MEVPVLLIEFEGVLAETLRLRADALTEALAADELETTTALLHGVEGLCTEEAIRLIRDQLGAPDDPTAVELARLRAERAFAARAGKGLRVAADARPTLERLTAVARLSLVTRASRREVEFVLDLAGLGALFRPIIACEDAKAPKPSPAPYALAMSRVTELFPGQALRGIAVEDSVRGVRAARAAGLLTIIVGDLAPQDAMEADAWYPTLSDLTPERLRSLLGSSPKGAR
ncbi:MAG: HAD family phosphatase [Gemmatimonadaceae bacterium]|nr:HAD family phosphatase [Gemmatimonadaceae bacterium]